ncbi:hypothetical protein ACFCW7_11020 [Paenibacillus glucanolyticus]|uniref:hypothetical protein n=1 Tax=Paenibacillus glucanolyticus TaxID=59843 RepID=UPI0035DB8AC2
MFYFLMALWLVASAATIALFISWLFSKVTKRDTRRKGKLTLYLFTSSVVLLVAGLIVNGNEPKHVTEMVVNSKEENTIIDATKFSRISPEELIKLMGEPESKEEVEIKLTETRSYDATYYIYEDSKYEFMVIDGEVVRFTFNGAYQEKNDNVEVFFRMFNISPGENSEKVADTPASIRFQMVNDKIADFWISFGDEYTIYKVTYNLKYFS